MFVSVNFLPFAMELALLASIVSCSSTAISIEVLTPFDTFSSPISLAFLA